MRRIHGGLPPRYGSLLRLTLAAALVRLAAFAPYVLVYFLPTGPWFRLLLLACPALWFLWVCPARVRYARLLSAFAADEAAPLRSRELFLRDVSWREAYRGRVKRMRAWALPLVVLLLPLLSLFLFFNPFSAVNILFAVFGGVATVLGTMANFVSRLLLGESPVQQAGVLGGVTVLAAAFLFCLGLFGVGAFRSSAYRFGYTAAMPGLAAMKPLLWQNLRLWFPTLALLGLLLAFSSAELGLLFSNILGAAPVFSVKLQLHEIALLLLITLSYLLFLPVRKYNTAKWTRNYLQAKQ